MNSVITKPPVDLRVKALRRFALSITVFNLAGRFWFGFEGAWSQLLVALLAGYSLEVLFELINAKKQGKPPRFLGSKGDTLNFFLPVHITCNAISILLYASDQLMPFVFASAIAVCSKFIFTAPVGKSRRHYLNPSNTGIVVTTILFPTVLITVPYQFTENLTMYGDILLPLFVVVTGTMLNWKLTKRMPLIISWIVSFALLGMLRAVLFGYEAQTGAMLMTGVAFVLFTYYMISDPGTTPFSKNGQIMFGFSVALVYNIWVIFHLTFGIFYALLIVCFARGIYLNVIYWLNSYKERNDIGDSALATNTTVLSEIKVASVSSSESRE